MKIEFVLDLTLVVLLSQNKNLFEIFDYIEESTKSTKLGLKKFNRKISLTR